MARYKRSAPASGPRRSTGSVVGRERGEGATLAGVARNNGARAAAAAAPRRRKRRMRPGALQARYRFEFSVNALAHHSSSPFQVSVRCVKSEHIKHLQICSFGGCRLLDWSEKYNSRCPVLPFAGKELLFWLYRKQPKLTFAVYSKMQIYVRFMVNG